jgi:hypothetical protein
MFKNKVKSAAQWLGWGLFSASFIGVPVLAAEVDMRSASLSCFIESGGLQVSCDYRHAAALGVKDVSLKVGEQAVQIPEKGVTNYPANEQSTALLFLVDVSDPRRKNTVETKNMQAVAAMLVSQKPHQKVGLAVFDSDMRVLAPIGADAGAMKSAVSNIKASGQATEFYKNILSAIALLQKTEATRRGLIIMSDGKDEDRAYKHADVIKAAQDAGVVILGLGYLERQTDSPYLQTLKRLADETYGQYFDATDQTLPAALESKPFSFVEKGGRVTFDVGSYVGMQEITIVLGAAEGQAPELKANVEFPDKRAGGQRAIDFGKKFWKFLVGGVVVLIVVIIVVVRYRRRKKAALPLIIDYAYLDEMDGSGTRYALTKTAVCIGRSVDNDVRFANDSISSHHAEIHRKREGDFCIVDLASANGVYVNDKKVAQVELHDGDLIELGEVRLRFVGK